LASVVAYKSMQLFSELRKNSCMHCITLCCVTECWKTTFSLLTLALYMFMFQDDYTSIKCEQDSGGDVSEARRYKKHKKMDKDSEVSHILTGAAKSMEKLVQVVADRTGIAEPSNDDWLFCKRMYLKLNKLPDNRQKDMFKVKMESELIGMTYGCSQHT